MKRIILFFFAIMVTIGCHQMKYKNSSTEINITHNKDAIVGDTVEFAGYIIDSNNSYLEYYWSFIKKPLNSKSYIIDSDKMNASFIPDQKGEYVANLKVFNGKTTISKFFNIKIQGLPLKIKPISDKISLSSIRPLSIEVEGKLMEKVRYTITSNNQKIINDKLITIFGKSIGNTDVFIPVNRSTPTFKEVDLKITAKSDQHLSASTSFSILLGEHSIQMPSLSRHFSFSGNRAIVTSNSRVHILEKKDGRWKTMKNLPMSSSPESVDIHGDYAITSNRQDGLVYIFYYNGKTWTEQAKLIINDFKDNPDTRKLLAISKNHAIVSIPASYRNNFRGAVYVFQRSEKTWIQKHKITGKAYEDFGDPIDIYGNYLIIGGDKAYIYHNKNNIWYQQAELKGLGYPHSLGIHGKYAIVSYKTGSKNIESGGIPYIFHRSGDKWSLQKELVSENKVRKFGHNVSISGDYIVVSEPGYKRGSIYIFKRDKSDWIKRRTINRANNDLNYYGFGYGFSIDNNQIHVWEHDDYYGSIFTIPKTFWEKK